MVDDGQPVVLTKSIRKALRIKDEQQTLDKAMKEDLIDIGMKQSEIAQHLDGGADGAKNMDDSDEDSAD